MIEMGFSTHLVKLIQSLNHEQGAVIRWNNERTENFNIQKSVRQGCILSSHIFNVYTEQITRVSNTQENRISVGGRESQISDMQMMQHSVHTIMITFVHF